MKYLVKFFVVTFFLLVCTYSFAEQKIVMFDMTFALNESKAGKGAQDFLKKSFTDNQKKFTEIEESLKQEEGDLLTKKNILTKDEYNKKTDSLRKKVIDYHSQRRASLDKITTQRVKAKETLLQKLTLILDSYMKENNISIVIDTKNTLGGNPEVDITEIIVGKLNKELPSLNLK